MKKRSVIVLLIMAVITVMLFTSCGKPTLESFMNDNPELKENIEQTMTADGTQGFSVSYSGNDLILQYDIKDTNLLTEEQAKTEEAKQYLQDYMDNNTESFQALSNSILGSLRSKGAEIESVNLVVKCVYGDELLASVTYTSDPISD